MRGGDNMWTKLIKMQKMANVAWHSAVVKN